MGAGMDGEPGRLFREWRKAKGWVAEYAVEAGVAASVQRGAFEDIAEINQGASDTCKREPGERDEAEPSVKFETKEGRGTTGLASTGLSSRSAGNMTRLAVRTMRVPKPKQGL